VRSVLKTLVPIDRMVVDPHTGRHFAARVLPYRRVDNYISGAVVTFTDLTAVHQAELAVRESEERLHSLVEGLTQLVWRAVDTGKWTWSSRQWKEYTGLADEDSREFGWMSTLHPDDRPIAEAAWAGAAEQGGFDVEYRIRRASDGVYRWFKTRVNPIRNEDGDIVEWIGTSTDINDLRNLQGRQGVLVAELQHRTRNLIGVVRQMAQKTLRGSVSLDDFRDRFRDRLDALARVQGLLSRLNEHDRVTFDELINTELAAQGIEAGEVGRVTVEGPSGVRLRSTTVQTLAMALHELMTNAVKYGALGQSAAALTIRWRIEAGLAGDEPWLHVDWRESGVTMPASHVPREGGGQGRELIERALPYQLAARTTYVLENDGVHCTIAMPVSASNEAGERDHG
jgi:two-component system CheB/CheR fusion protein